MGNVASSKRRQTRTGAFLLRMLTMCGFARFASLRARMIFEISSCSSREVFFFQPMRVSNAPKQVGEFDEVILTTSGGPKTQRKYFNLRL